MFLRMLSPVMAARPMTPPETTSAADASFRVSVETRDCDAERERLAAEALVPNVFHEPWMAKPAAAALDQTLVEVAVRRGEQLVGWFPLVRRSRLFGMPASVLATWSHDYGPLGTPLVHRRYAVETLAALLDWAARDRLGAKVLRFEMIDAEGPFAHALRTACEQALLVHLVAEEHCRAFLERRPSCDAYLEQAVPGKSRQEFRRLRRRLGEQGDLQFRQLGPGEPVGPWIDQFLALEAQGWKERTALAADAKTATFFRDVCTAAHERGRLQLMGLFLGERPVALKCNFLAQDGGFALKIAFDEEFSRYSPGILLELENLRELHASADLRWMDSCACPGHSMIDRLWSERRAMETRLVSTGSRWADGLLALAAFGKVVKRSWRRARGRSVRKRKSP